jgi:hypothetical protein
MVGLKFLANPLLPNTALQGAGFDSHTAEQTHWQIMALLVQTF